MEQITRVAARGEAVRAALERMPADVLEDASDETNTLAWLGPQRAQSPSRGQRFHHAAGIRQDSRLAARLVAVQANGTQPC